MRVLVTGGAGYIGSVVAEELVADGHGVVVYDNLSKGHRTASPAGADFVRGELTDAENLRRAMRGQGTEAVIHMAAHSLVGESVTDPAKYYRNNVTAGLSLLDAMNEEGVKKIVFSSTAAVYGNAEAPLLTEDMPLSPINPYGRSKLMSEWMLQDAHHAHGLRYAILRYFNVAGADPKGRSGQSTPQATHLIKVAAQAALGQRPHLDVFGTDYATPDGTCVRDYIQVNDLARAHLVALRHLRGGGGCTVMNCGYGHGASVLDVIKVVKEVSGVDFEVRLSPRRPGDPAQLVARVDRIRSLGWEPQHDDLADIVDQALRWERTLAERKAA